MEDKDVWVCDECAPIARVTDKGELEDDPGYPYLRAQHQLVVEAMRAAEEAARG
jgi:hypothetical protein